MQFNELQWDLTWTNREPQKYLMRYGIKHQHSREGDPAAESAEKAIILYIMTTSKKKPQQTTKKISILLSTTHILEHCQ